MYWKVLQISPPISDPAPIPILEISVVPELFAVFFFFSPSSNNYLRGIDRYSLPQGNIFQSRLPLVIENTGFFGGEETLIFKLHTFFCIIIRYIGLVLKLN